MSMRMGLLILLTSSRLLGARQREGSTVSAPRDSYDTHYRRRQWLAQAQGLDLTDATLQRGIIFLEQLLAALTPKETLLLPNYPNFNPETWIPVSSRHDADVRLTIYDTTGAMTSVRFGASACGILHLGQRRRIGMDVTV